MVHCNDCQDIVHNSIQNPCIPVDSLTLLVCQILLLVIACSFFKVNMPMMKHLILSGFVIFIIGFVSSRISKCNIGSGTWNIIMERFMMTLLIFLFLYKSEVPMYFKILAFAIMCCVGFVDICSRRHFTSDLVITLTFIYLVIGLFDHTKLGLSSSMATGVAFFCTMSIVLLFFVVDINYHCQNEVSQRHDRIRNITIELFTVLSVAGLVLFAMYYSDQQNCVYTPQVFVCSIVFFVCVIVVTLFYFSLVKSANVASIAIIITTILYFTACLKTGCYVFASASTDSKMLSKV